MPTIAPYGSWKSPITPDLIAQDSVGLGPVQLGGDDIYWVEMRPDEGARNVIHCDTLQLRRTESTART